jgi:hypothetical protein
MTCSELRTRSVVDGPVDQRPNGDVVSDDLLQAARTRVSALDGLVWWLGSGRRWVDRQ